MTFSLSRLHQQNVLGNGDSTYALRGTLNEKIMFDQGTPGQMLQALAKDVYVYMR
jgi:hypothetical protein